MIISIHLQSYFNLPLDLNVYWGLFQRTKKFIYLVVYQFNDKSIKIIYIFSIQQRLIYILKYL